MANLIKQKAKAIVLGGITTYFIIAFIFMVAIFYVYFANKAVRTLTVLEKTRDEMQSLSMKVSEMESKRLAMENGISTEKALQMGFKEVNNPIFIVKNNKTSLTLNTN